LVVAEHTITAVTGAGGWLGKALVERLVADGRRHLRLLAATNAEAATLSAFVATLEPPANTDRPHVDVLVGDIARSETAARLLHGCDATSTVLHTAGIIHPRNVRTFFAVNAQGARHMAEAATDAGVRKFVHVSSNSPFGTNPHPTDVFRADEPFNPYYGYGRSKMAAELAVTDMAGRGLNAVIVRPPWFYGPHQPARQTTFFTMVRRGKFPIIGDGTQRRSMVYVGNLVDGILCAERTVTTPGAGYWIADARPYPLTEIIDTVGAALRDEGYDVAPRGRALPALVGRLAETGDRWVQRLGLYQQQLHVLGEMDKTIACDISASQRDLDYHPSVELYDGMRRSIAWCRAQGITL
jgi:nucleoside-diphosphate-sugar epimerase